MTNIGVELHEVDDQCHESLRLLHTLPKKANPTLPTTIFASEAARKSQNGPDKSQKIAVNRPEITFIFDSLAWRTRPDLMIPA